MTTRTPILRPRHEKYCGLIWIMVPLLFQILCFKCSSNAACCHHQWNQYNFKCKSNANVVYSCLFWSDPSLWPYSTSLVLKKKLSRLKPIKIATNNKIWSRLSNIDIIHQTILIPYHSIFSRNEYEMLASLKEEWLLQVKYFVHKGQVKHGMN